MKWLAVALVLLGAALMALLYEVRSPGPTAASASAAIDARPVTLAPTGSRAIAAPVAATEEAPSPPPPEEDESGEPPIAKLSEEFWSRIDEVYSRRLVGQAADCYQGGKDRKQKLKLAFRFEIAGGQITVSGARIVDSTLNDPALEKCMLAAVATARFSDPRMPDWSSPADEEETVLIRISGLKRFGAPSP